MSKLSSMTSSTDHLFEQLLSAIIGGHYGEARHYADTLLLPEHRGNLVDYAPRPRHQSPMLQPLIDRLDLIDSYVDSNCLDAQETGGEL